MSNILGPPTQSGYTQFLRSAGFTTAVLPDNSQAITLSLAIAQGIVSCQLNQIDPDIYTLAVYNLATDRLVWFAQDQPGQTYFGGDPNANPPVKGLRQQYNIYAFVAGVIESSSDNGTSQSIAVPESLRSLQLLDLQNLATPWGRQYLAFAQMLGSLWGLN